MEKTLELKISNMLGQTVSVKTISAEKGMSTIPVDANLANGIYSIQLSDGKASVTRTFVVRQ